MAMADEALALASKTWVPQEVVNWLRIVRQAFSTDGKRTSSDALRALVVLSDDPAISNDALAADTLRLQAARGWRTTKLKEAPLLLERIEPVASVSGMSACGLVIEAATEREPIKRAIFADVGKVLGHQAVLASNTSSIPITRLAQASPDPARFVGVHFFNPVPVMGLIEVIRGLATTVATVSSEVARRSRRCGPMRPPWASRSSRPMTRRASSSIAC